MSTQERDERMVWLIAKYITRTKLTTEEQNTLDTWVKESSYNQLMLDQMLDEENFGEGMKEFSAPSRDTMYQKLHEKMGKLAEEGKLIELPKKGGGFFHWRKYAAAAVVLILIASGAFLIIKPGSSKTDMATTTITNHPQDVQPGKEKAVLTLSDGTQIVLDSSANGTIASEDNTVVIKEDGLLAYNTTKENGAATLKYNTLSTPRGAEYRSLVLADGTKVWLNAESSIRFPIAFAGNDRRVEITGEAYFEVAKNRAMPFIVGAGDVSVEVLGTHFNINSYTNEGGIKTTLLEGAVKVKSTAKTVTLRPGQQARADEGGELAVLNNVNMEQVMAWKDGLFMFDGANIRTIMRQVSRWYDVDISFNDEIPGDFVILGVSRSVPVSKLLDALEKNGAVDFEISGKTIVVKRK